MRTKHAVAYNIQIVGEAVYKLTKEFKTAHQETPWALIEKMRHILVHDYYQVNMQIMWDVITNDLPALKVQVEGFLEECRTEMYYYNMLCVVISKKKLAI